MLAALLVSGMLQAVISPPWSWVWLHPFVWAPGLWVISRLSPGRAFWAGWLIGISANCTIFYWLIETVENFSNLPSWAAAISLALFGLVFGFYAAVFGWGYAAVRQATGEWWPVGIAVWFTACEYLNPQLFPYFQGVAWYQWPRFFLVTSLTGVSGITFLVILANAVLLQAFEQRRSRARPFWNTHLVRNLAVLAGGVLFAVVWSSERLELISRAEMGAPRLRVALVQTNRDVDAIRLLMKQSRTALPDDYLALSREAWERDPRIEVFIWPEGAIKGTPDEPKHRAVLEFVRETGTEIWTGGSFSRTVPDGRRVSYNSAFRIHGDGEIDARYDKTMLLPFGEFMPLAGQLPVLRQIQGVGNFEPGAGFIEFESPLARFAFLICYEAIQHRYVRAGTRMPLDLLVNLTYDAWYGDTANPHQHLMLAAVQSAQYGVPQVRAATTGISATIDARGSIVKQTGVFTRTVLVDDVQKVRVASPYAVLGDWLAWGCILTSGLLLIRGFGEAPLVAPRAWVAWAAVLTATTFVPLAWVANPYASPIDWLAWAWAVTSLLVIGWRSARRRRGLA